MKEGPVVVCAATHEELALLIRESKAILLADAGPRQVWGGECAGRELVLALTGIGKVNAASAVTALIERHAPPLIINTGCAGAYDGSGLVVGDLAIATAEVYGDEGVLTSAGWHSLELIGIPAVERKGTRFANEFPLSMEASAQAAQLGAALGLPVRRGKFVTVSTCSGTAARGAEMVARFGGICENMEGAAVAHIALLYGIDCLEVRGVSNMVEDRDLSRWDVPLAVEMAQRFLLRLLAGLQLRDGDPSGSCRCAD